MPSMDYLLGEIVVDGPEHRAEAVAFNKEGGRELEWPEGWWAVSDDQFAYVAFFQFEPDAWAYRLYLINLRMNAKDGQKRYAKADKGIVAEERRQDERNEEAARLREDEWVVGTSASNGTFYMRNDCTPTKDLDEAHGYAGKTTATANAKEWGKPRTFVKKRRECRTSGPARRTGKRR